VISAVGNGIKANDSRGSDVVLAIKKQEFNLCGIAGKDAEVDATIARCCPEWSAFTRFARN